jgi:hypothetical protein
MRGNMKRLFAVLLLAALVFTGADADPAAGCPAEIARGRQLIDADVTARSARCVYGPPTETVCGVNDYGWGGVPVRHNARRVVCVFDEPLIPEINGGGN